jgi:hypothetical protein
VSGLICISTSIYHLIYILFFYSENNNYFHTLGQHPILLTIACISTFIASLFTWCKCRNYWFIIPPAVIGLGLFTAFFYMSLEKGYKYPIYYNPISLLILISSTPLTIFVLSFAIKQTNLVTRLLTTKQYESITKEIIHAEGNIKKQVLSTTYNLRGKLSIKDKLYNLLNFIKKKNPKCLITESDLGYN